MSRHWWKEAIKRVTRPLGYEITRRGERGRYTLSPAFGQFVYAPWFEPWFQEIFGPLRTLSAAHDDRGYTLYRFAQHAAHLDGDFAEAGVYRGGTATLAARAIEESGRTDRMLHLFDTFEGMPASADSDASTHRKGDLNQTSLAEVQGRLARWPFVKCYPGFIPDSLAPVGDRKFAFVHVDVDLYSSTRDSFRFFYERVVRGGIMLCDDYGAPAYEKSAKLAVDEFFADKVEKPIGLGSGQCLVIKL